MSIGDRIDEKQIAALEQERLALTEEIDRLRGNDLMTKRVRWYDREKARHYHLKHESVVDQEAFASWRRACPETDYARWFARALPITSEEDLDLARELSTRLAEINTVLLTSALQDSFVRRIPKDQKKRGAKPRYNWNEAKDYVFSQLDHHGNIIPEDSSFSQADLERGVSDILSRTHDHTPSVSTVRERVVAFIAEWRKKQAGI